MTAPRLPLSVIVLALVGGICVTITMLFTSLFYVEPWLVIATVFAWSLTLADYATKKAVIALVYRAVLMRCFALTMLPYVLWIVAIRLLLLTGIMTQL